MPTANDIKQLIEHRFSDAHVTVTDDSAMHAGHATAPAGGGSHFTVRVVSAEFAGVNNVARHRLIYAALAPLFASGLHALAIEALAPGESRAVIS